MKTLGRQFARFAGLFRKEDGEASLREEMQMHLELQTQELVDAGMSPAHAREEALRRFGHVEGIKEQCRDEKRFLRMEQAWMDVVHGVGFLYRSKRYALSVILILALGLSALAVVLELSRQILFPPQPFAQPERMRIIQCKTGQYSQLLIYRSQYEQLRQKTEGGGCGLETVAAQSQEMLNLVEKGVPFPISVISVTPRFFELCAVRPMRGRVFTREEAEKGDGSVVILSHFTWEKRYGLDPDIIGRKVELGGRMLNVIGVMPYDFRCPMDRASWDAVVPMRETGPEGAQSWTMMAVFGRLREGAKESALAAELGTIGLPQEIQFNDTMDRHLEMTPLMEKYITSSQFVIYCLLGSALFLYAIACTNAVTLILVRTRGRSRELGVRVSLGASSWQVRRLLLIESLLLGLAATFVAMLAALWADSAFVSYVNFWWFGPIRVLPGPLVQLVVVLGLPSAVVIGLIPALRVVPGDPAMAMKEGGSSVGQTRGARRWMEVGVMVQVALAVTLLSGAGLMLRSLYKLRETGVGFDAIHKIGVHGIIPASEQQKAGASWTKEAYLAKLEALRAEFERLPSVKTALIADSAPLGSWYGMGGPVLGETAQTPLANCMYVGVSPAYMRALGIPVRKGAGMSELRRGDALSVLINETCAREAFHGVDPVGKWIDLGDTMLWGDYQKTPPERIRARVLGVAADVRAFGQRFPASAQVFYPYWQRPSWQISEMGFIVETKGDVDASFEDTLRRIAYEVVPTMTVSTLRLDQEKEWKLSNERYAFTLFNVLAGLALLLTLAGMYSVLAYVVQQRNREFGLRLALGADANALMHSVLRRGFLLGVSGVLAGLFCAWIFSRFLERMLFEVSPHDPWVYAIVACLLLAISLLASWVPARRALRIDPIQALRDE